MSHCFYDAADRPSIVFHQIQASGERKRQVLTSASGLLGYHVLAEVSGYM